MLAAHRVHVLKFGSSVLARPACFPGMAEEIRTEITHGAKIVAVVSAMGDTTDRLLRAARAVGESPPGHLLGPLLATGEEASVALLSLALASAQVRALGIPFWRIPVRTRGPLEAADPVAVDTRAIEAALATHEAVVLPGFVGVDSTGATSLLGRGGSDLTALFLAHALDASEVRLVKDVDGLFPADPKERPGLAPIPRATWAEARRTAGGAIQERALHFAERHRLAFRIAAPGSRGTWIGEEDPTPERDPGRKGTFVTRDSGDRPAPRVHTAREDRAAGRQEKER